MNTIIEILHVTHRNEGDVGVDLLALRYGVAQDREGGVRYQGNQSQYGGQRSARYMVYSLKCDQASSESQTPDYAVPVDSPAGPPLANVVVGRHEQCLPRSRNENFLEEHLR